jgi:hypothetical protein
VRLPCFLLRKLRRRAPFFVMAVVLILGAQTVSAKWGQTPSETPSGGGQTLTIVNAGIESAEDAPFVAPDYLFNPGDFVYLIFEISGYKAVGSEYNGPRHISLKYKAEPLDRNGVPLAAAATGTIEQEIGKEDKNWMPKRRASFLLPSYLARGTYHINVAVEDLLAKAKETKELLFNIAGPKIEPGSGLAVQRFRFERNEQDGPGLDVPAYRPGDTVWARFDMTGFKTGQGNAVDVAYGITVFRPNGTQLFEQKSAAREKVNGEFYPPQFVPGILSVTTTKDLSPGEYKLVVHVNDLLGQQRADFEQSFRVE